MKKIVPVCLCAYVLMFQTAWADDWKKIDKGLHYAKVETVHVFKIDPNRFRFSVITAPELGQKTATAKEFARHQKALLAINGGFFSPEQKSLGLIVRNGRQLNPPHNSHWWAVFFVRDKKAAITPPDVFQLHPDVEIALQVGPRLLVQKVIPKLKPSEPRPRSGVCILKNEEILVAATGEETLLEVQKFAEWLRERGCEHALNLDGGSSTQLFVNWKGFQLDLAGAVPVTNAVTLFPR